MNTKEIKKEIDSMITELEELIPVIKTAESRLKKAELSQKLRQLQVDIEEYLGADFLIMGRGNNMNEISNRNNIQIANGNNNQISNE